MIEQVASKIIVDYWKIKCKMHKHYNYLQWWLEKQRGLLKEGVECIRLKWVLQNLSELR